MTRLQGQNVQLSKSRSEREVDANDSRAKLHAAEEKVSKQDGVEMLHFPVLVQ